MAINKVEYGGNTLIDITDTTATENDVLNGEIFYNANGTRGVGSLSLGNAKTYYGTSSTGASTAAKTVTCSGFTLETGATIFVKFTNGNSYNGTATLNVNSTGAVDIATVGDTKTSRYYWKSGEIVGFIYDGTNYVMIEQGSATTTYYGVTKLSSSTSSTSEAVAATPKAVKTAYDLANGKQDALTFDTTPTSGSTNPVTSGGIYSKLYNDYISYSSWDTTNYVYSVANKSSVANLLAVDANNKVRIGNLPTANSISDDSTTIPKTSAVNSALSSKADTSDIPTKVSDLTNDAGYISSYTETDPIFSASAASGITSSDITSWNNKSTFSGDYDDLTNKPTIPTVNNGKLQFSKDNVKVTEFTANSSTNVNVDLTNEVKDVQINGTSILSNKEANIKTNGVYNSSSNKIATMSDIPTVKPTVNSNSTNTIGYLAVTGTAVSDINDYTLSGEYSLAIDGNTNNLPFTISGNTTAILKVSGNNARFYQIIEVPYMYDAYKRNYVAGTGFSAWEKIPTIDDIPQDTGWINLSHTKGTWSVLRYRKFGKEIHIEGRASSFAWSGSGTDTFATIPSGYRPTDATKQYIIALAGSRIARLYVTTDGNIGIDWALNVSNGSNYTSANWYQFQISYFID